MKTPSFAGKLSILSRQIVSLKSGVGKSAGEELARRDFRFQFTVQILVT